MNAPAASAVTSAPASAAAPEALLRHVPEAIRNLPPYKPGRPAAPADDLVILAANENPLGAGEAAAAALRDLPAAALSRYPDASGATLRHAIAAHLNLPADTIILGNGSNEILELAAHLTLHQGAAAVYSRHAFIVYALATATRRARPIIVPAAPDHAHDLPSMAAAASANQNARLMFIANPNNPTGTCHSAAAIRQTLQNTPPRVLAVLDEAYCDYTPDAGAATLALLQNFPNLLIARTFSKLHGLAGLRIGYGIGHPDLIDHLNRIRQPFNTSVIAQRAAAAALQDRAHIQKSRAMNQEGKQQLMQEFARRDIPHIAPHGNFIAFMPPAGADHTYTTLQQAGIILRRLPEYDMPEWLRLTIGTAQQNERFLRALPA